MGCARTLVKFFRRDDTKDSTGGASTVFTQIATSYSEMNAVKGFEDLSTAQGNRQAPVETWLLVLNFRSDLEGITDHKAVIDGVDYNIRSSMDRDRNRRKLTMEIQRGVAV